MTSSAKASQDRNTVFSAATAIGPSTDSVAVHMDASAEMPTAPYPLEPMADLTKKAERDKLREQFRSIGIGAVPASLADALDACDQLERERDEALDVMLKYINDLDAPVRDITMLQVHRNNMRGVLRRAKRIP